MITTAKTTKDLASFFANPPSPLSPASVRGDETKRGERTMNPVFTMFASLIMAHSSGRET